jgi:uncharacterized OsmC-like protein
MNPAGTPPALRRRLAIDSVSQEQRPGRDGVARAAKKSGFAAGTFGGPPCRLRLGWQAQLRDSAGPGPSGLKKGIAPMDAAALKALQAPLKDRYREAPEAAVVTLKAEGRLGEGVTCSLQTGKALVEAGLHPATGGSGQSACSGDMLLEALVACAGVTLNAVATALGLAVRDARVKAEGDLDFRGTLGVAKDAPVGFRAIRLSFEIDGDLTEEQRATVMKLTERYCVVYQTLRAAPPIDVTSRMV